MRRRLPTSRITHDRWLVSYADFITLLFGFFVVLFAFSKADRQKQSQVVASIDAAFKSLGVSSEAGLQFPGRQITGPGVEPDIAPTDLIMAASLVSPDRVRQDLNQTRRNLEKNLSGEVAMHTISIHMGRDGLVISLREAGFFASGSATPGAGTLQVLRKVATSLAGIPYDMRIEGHTDNLPIHSVEFDSNWELSTARATTIARIVLNLDTLPPERISAAGYAGFHPIASNDTEEGRSENRRVDLVLVPRTKTDFSASEAGQSDGRPWRKVSGE